MTEQTKARIQSLLKELRKASYSEAYAAALGKFTVEMEQEEKADAIEEELNELLNSLK